MDDAQSQADEFNRLVASSDILTFSLVDQMTIAKAYAELMAVVKPVLLKNLIKDTSGTTTYLYKL